MLGKQLSGLALLAGHAGIAFVLMLMLVPLFSGLDIVLSFVLAAIIGTNVILHASAWYMKMFRWPEQPEPDSFRQQVARELHDKWRTRSLLVLHGIIWAFGIVAYALTTAFYWIGVLHWTFMAIVWTLPLIAHGFLTMNVWLGRPHRADEIINAEVERRLREQGYEKRKVAPQIIEDPFEADDVHHEPIEYEVGDDGELTASNHRR